MLPTWATRYAAIDVERICPICSTDEDLNRGSGRRNGRRCLRCDGDGTITVATTDRTAEAFLRSLISAHGDGAAEMARRAYAPAVADVAIACGSRAGTAYAGRIPLALIDGVTGYASVDDVDVVLSLDLERKPNLRVGAWRRQAIAAIQAVRSEIEIYGMTMRMAVPPHIRDEHRDYSGIGGAGDCHCLACGHRGKINYHGVCSRCAEKNMKGEWGSLTLEKQIEVALGMYARDENEAEPPTSSTLII